MDTATAATIADEVMTQAREIASVPGIAYGVIRHGELVHATGRGAASLGGHVPTPDTVFRIASMTKSFTAATILSLRDAGQLRLDDPLVDYLPATRTIGAPVGPVITIRDLLTMGAGLPTDDPWGDRQEPLPPADFDRLVAAGLSFCRAPRTAFEYSNTGYALLGRVIENVTGVAFTDVVQDRICEPLGMAATRFDARDVPADVLATGYRIPAEGIPVPEPLVVPGAYSAMGGLHSSVRDLARWVTGFLAAWTTGLPEHPVDRWSLREAQEMARYASMDTTTCPGAGTVVHGYGFGLMVEEHEVLGRVVSHSGGYPGFGSHMRWHPGSGWGVVAVGNATYAAMRVPATTLLARLVEESETAHGAKPAVEETPWPQTLRAMELAEALLRGSDMLVTDELWSPNMDLDLPREELMRSLANVRDAVGRPTRVDGSVEYPTPGRATWMMTGDAGAVKMEILMTPELSPRLQKLTVTRSKD